MKALTLHQPWAWCIVHAGKRIENRTWAPPRSVVGQRIAIHAGKTYDEDAAMSLSLFDGVFVPGHNEIALGAVVATAEIVGAFHKDRPSEAWLADQQKWFAGPWAWCLDRVRPIDPPVQCRGKQGIWDLSDDVLVDVRQFERGDG